MPMRQVLLAVVVLSLAASLIGCGGSSSVSHVDPTIDILGAWQPITATQDGAPVAVSVAMNWPIVPKSDPEHVWTRSILQFANTGQLNELGYDELIHMKTVEGTWTHTPGVVTISLDGVDTVISYTISGNLLTANFSRGGHAYVLTWVRVVDLTVHDTNLADDVSTSPAVEHKWRAASITTVPADAAVTLKSYFGMAADANTLDLTLGSDGTAKIEERNGTTLVGLAKNGTWGTGDGEFGLSLFTDGLTPAPNTVFSNDTRGIYTLVGSQLTTTFLDVPTGRTITIVWNDIMVPG
jgi:hypothetical protein